DARLVLVEDRLVRVEHVGVRGVLGVRTRVVDDARAGGQVGDVLDVQRRLYAGVGVLVGRRGRAAVHLDLGDRVGVAVAAVEGADAGRVVALELEHGDGHAGAVVAGGDLGADAVGGADLVRGVVARPFLQVGAVRRVVLIPGVDRVLAGAHRRGVGRHLGGDGRGRRLHHVLAGGVAGHGVGDVVEADDVGDVPGDRGRDGRAGGVRVE